MKHKILLMALPIIFTGCLDTDGDLDGGSAISPSVSAGDVQPGTLPSGVTIPAGQIGDGTLPVGVLIGSTSQLPAPFDGSCNANEIPEWTGTVWRCLPTPSGVGTVPANGVQPGILQAGVQLPFDQVTGVLNPLTQLDGNLCGANQILESDGTSFLCVDQVSGSIVTDTDPATNLGGASEGDVAYDTTDGELQVFDGTNWVAAGGGAASSVPASGVTAGALPTGVTLSNISQLPAPLSGAGCTTDQILVWDGSAWVCAGNSAGAVASGATNPAVATDGDVFYNTGDDVLYVYDGTNWVPSGDGASAGSIVTDTDPATNLGGASEGDVAYDTTDGELQVFDGTNWVAAGGSGADNLGNHTATQKLNMDGNTIVGAAADTQGVHVASGGNVGVGTISPTDLLTVSGSGNPRVRINSSDSGTQFVQYPNTAAAYWDNGSVGVPSVFRVSNSSVLDTAFMTALSNGNVGVGTATPTSSLEVSNSTPDQIKVTSSGVVSSIIFSNSGSTGGTERVQNNGDGIGFINNGGYALYTEGGNVGIGTTSPSEKFDVRLGNIALNNAYELKWGNSKIYGYDGVGGYITFWVNGSQSLFLADGGNVGIGTIAPEVELDIDDGVVNASAICDENNANCIDLSVGAAASAFRAVTVNPTAGMLAGDAVYNTTDNTTYVYNGTVWEPTASSGGSNSVISDADPATNLSGAAAGDVVFNSTSGELEFFDGTVWTSTVTAGGDDLGDHTATENLKLGSFQLVGNGGSSGVSVANDGNVGVGTTSPTEKLHVVDGKMRIDNSGALNSHFDLNSDIGRSSFVNVRKNNLLRWSMKGDGQSEAGADTGSNMQFLSYDDTGAFLNTVMHMERNGNVGIGTTAPVKKLDVIASASGDGIRLGNSAGDKRALLSHNAADDGYFQLSTTGDVVTAQVHSDGSTYFNGGNVGIGTTTPADKLDVQGNIRTNSDLVIQGSASGGSGSRLLVDSMSSISHRLIEAKNNNGTYFVVNGNGHVGIGTVSPTHPLHMGSGAHVTAAGVWTDASDKRRKEETSTDFSTALEQIMSLKPVRYYVCAEMRDSLAGNCSGKFADDKKAHMGFYAQDLLKIFPESVSGTEEEGYGVSYGSLMAPVVASVQDLAIENKSQAKEIARLKNELAELKEMVKDLVSKK